MRNYLNNMKYIMGFTAVLAVLLFGSNFVTVGNATVVPAGNNIALGTAPVAPPVFPGAASLNVNPAFVGSAVNPFFKSTAVNPFFVRPAFNPFFVRPAFNPFLGPFFNPFLDADVAPFGAFGAAD